MSVEWNPLSSKSNVTLSNDNEGRDYGQRGMSSYDFILRFATEHPFLTFCVIVCLYEFVVGPFKLVNRWIRHKNIESGGWPPPHLDADGDKIESER